MKYQYGQALTEGLIVLLCVLAFFVAITWLGRLQDVALYEQHASRFGAFEFARAGRIDNGNLLARFFQGRHARWHDRQGNALVVEDRIQVTSDRQARLDPRSQPGAVDRSASILRKEWALQDSGIVNVSLRIRPRATIPSEQTPTRTERAGWSLEAIDSLAVSLRRHTAILVDAGHAVNARSAHERAARSGTAWQQVARASYAAGKKITAAAMPVDAPWGRAAPVFDWFMPWAGKKP
ncbi:MAG TPA: pilus assembly protein [Advenella sp.]|nr:pilus assembly protein [Advenella sp.]